jgi:MFS family permease
VTSLFTDISSEMIVPVRFLFLVITLHTPLVLAGAIEGIAESSSSLLKVASGHVSDRVPDRKPLIVAGYSLSNLAKPFLALAQAWPVALVIIVLDRIGKGLRTSPRDALLADSAGKHSRGKAFGLHRGMDTLGAAIGPLLTAAILAVSPATIQNSAVVFYSASMGGIRSVFAWTAVPGVLGILVVILFLRERRRESPDVRTADRRETWAAMRSLGQRFWLFTAIATVFSLGNSSDAFIFLRTADLEHSIVAVPLVYFGYNMVFAILATPLGSLSDRIGRLPLLQMGYLVFAVVYGGWAIASAPWQAVIIFLLYGVYAAATDGVGKAFVTDLIAREQRGTAMGWFNGLTGIAALPGNILAGWLWARYGAGSPFLAGALLAVLAAFLLLFFEVAVKPAGSSESA